MSTCTKVLFVCNQNKFRSRTAETLYNRHSQIEAKSAGIDPDATVPLTADHIAWADRIFVFDNRQLKRIRTKYKSILGLKRVISLNIPDEFEYMDPILVSELTRKLTRILGPPAAH